MKKIVLAVLVLAGCMKPPVWDRPGASSQDFAMDQGQCQAQAYGVPGMAPMQVAIVYNSCMRGKGWQQVRE